jgi:hypothetical protein
MTNTNEFAMAWGAVDNEENNNGAGTPKDKLDFLKLDIGDTKVRVLDMIPFSYKEWWAPRGNGGNGCSVGYFPNGEDLLEAKNKAHMNKIFKEADNKGLKDKARKDFLRDFGYKKQPFGKVKEKHVIHVLDRATGEVKLLDKGNGVFKELKKYAMNPEYGDLRNYDITITMSGDKADFQTIEYSVTPARSNTPLTDEEKALYEAKKIDLKAYKTPNYTPEQALMIANGATFKDVLGTEGEAPQEVANKSDESMLPPAEKETPPAQEEPKEEPKREDAPIEKGEALSEDELNGIDFN